MHRLAKTASAIFLTLAVSASGAAHAATIEIAMFGGGDSGFTPEGFIASDGFAFTPLPFDALSGARSEMAMAAGNFGRTSALAEYSIDATTGQLRFRTAAESLRGPDGGRGSSGATVQMSLRETYQVSGSGRVTIGMELSANWSAQDFFLQAQTRPDAAATPPTGLFLTTPVGPQGFANFETATTGPGVGSVDRLILQTVFDVVAPEGGFLDFVWFLQGSVSVVGGNFLSESGVLDAMNTANIFVRTEGDVTATAQTAGFLSNQVFGSTPEVSVVPLPASAVLLMAGLAGLGLVRWRRTA